MNQNDPRYPLVLEQARVMVTRNFNMIPGVLFNKACELAQNQGKEASDVLELVGSNRRECMNCGEEVEEGIVIQCECIKGRCICELDSDEFEDDDHHWTCESCDCNSAGEEIAYENLPFSGPRYGGWPAAHGIVFWTTDWPMSNEYSPGIVAAAIDAGFLVYEPQEFDGHILAIDGGGYDFYESHWVPLYLALGLKWHENEEGWQEALKKRDRIKRQRLNTKE
jgi:hypothetical protein